MRRQALVFRSSVLALLLAGMGLAQTPTPTVVRWQLGAPNSDHVFEDGLEFGVLKEGGVTVKATLTVLSVEFPIPEAQVLVVNGTDRRVEVLPSRMTLDLVEPERKPYDYLQPDWLAAQLRHMSNKDMDSNSIWSLKRELKEDKMSRSFEVKRDALRENTVLPGQLVAGAVFFIAPKHYVRYHGKQRLAVILRVPIGDYVFEFPLFWEAGRFKFPQYSER